MAKNKLNWRDPLPTPPAAEQREGQWKRCSYCNKELPLDDLHFHRDADKEDGFKPDCVKCRRLKRKRARDRALGRMAEKLRKYAVDQFTEDAFADGNLLPHSAEIYQRMMERCGGAAGFADMMMLTFWDAKPGGQTRLKILQGIMALGHKLSESEHTKLPAEMLEDDDLKRTIDGAVKRVFRIAAPEHGQENPQSSANRAG